MAHDPTHTPTTKQAGPIAETAPDHDSVLNSAARPAPKRTNPRMTDEASRTAGRVLAGVLGETDHRVVYLLAKIIFAAGVGKVQAILVETQVTEAAGGLLRADGVRRTFGGVFFHLAKHGAHKLSSTQSKRCGLYVQAMLRRRTAS